MKQRFTKQTRGTHVLSLLFALLLTAWGAIPVWAETLTEGFTSSVLPDGWSISGGGTLETTFSLTTDYNRSGSIGNYCLGRSSSSDPYPISYIITPKVTGTVTIYYRSWGTGSGNKKIFVYKWDGTAVDGTALASDQGTTSTYQSFNINLGTTETQLAIRLQKTVIDDFTADFVTEGAIAKPTSFAVSSTTYNSATFGWTAGGTETDWQLVYGTTGFDKAGETPIDITTNPYTLTGLTESTTYDAYLRAKSGEDVSAWTSKVTFTTPAQFPVPTGLAASGETTNAATLSWTAGSTETAWEIRYSTESDFDPAAEEGSLVSVTTTPSKGITGLTANTTYYAAVRAKYSESNYSAWTDKISFKTLQVATSAANYSDDFESANNWNLINGAQTNAWAWGTATNNGGLKALYISNDGGTTNAYGTGSSMVYAQQLFSFSAGEYIVSYDWLCKGEKGSYTNYDYLRVALVPAATELVAGTSTPSGFSSSSLPSGWIALDNGALLDVTTWQHKSVNINIPSNANYYVVFAWTNDGSGGSNPPAAIDNFAIRINDTPNPTNLAVTSITAHAGTLGWDDTDNTWEVYHSTSSTTPAVDQTPTASPSTNSYTFTGLDAETKYYVWVRSVSKTNVSWKSDWVGTNFTTDIAAVAPTGLTASSITATGATLTWTAGADETKWDLVYGTVNDATSPSNTSEEISTTPTKVLTGLTSEITYYAFVRAKKGEEVSSWVSISFLPTATVQLTVNDGEATNNGIPIYGYFADNAVGHSQFIIPATSLTAIDGGEIKKLTFYSSNANITWANATYTPTFKVYLKEVEETEFASTSFIDWSTMTEVYSGSLSIVSNQMVVTFPSDFEYNGRNLMVGINETVRGTYVNSSWYGVETSGNTALMQTGTYSPSGPGYAQFLPKTTITYIPVTGAKMQVNKTAIDFGSVTTVPQNETFTISNSKGKADLTNIAVTLTGDSKAAYSVSALPRTTITTTGETATDIELTVTFNPAAGGTYNDAAITISADDQEDAVIALTGTYLASPAMGVFNDALASEAATTGQTIDFGYVEAAPIYTYYIKNTGAGTLDVVVTDGGFTVSPANASLAAGEQQAFTITAGVANADATVTFTGTNHDGGAAIGTFTVTLQGTVMPLTTTFFEGFNYATGDETPDATTTELTGWEINNDANTIKFYQGKIYYYASTTETANVITPKLHVTGTSDVLRVAAYTAYTYASSKLIISYSADKTNWTIAATKVGNSDFDGKTYVLKDFEVSGIPEGNWYFKIEMCDVAVDFFYGFSSSLTPTLALTETAAPSLDAGVQDVDLTYTKTAEKWGTIALPFETTTTELGTVYGTTVKAYEFTGYDSGTNAISFGSITTLEAGKPYVIYSEGEMSGTKNFYNKNITATSAGNVTFSPATFQATYAPIAASGMNGKWGVTPEGKIAKGNASASIKGFRAYFDLPAGATAPTAVFEDTTTGIKTVVSADELNLNGEVYNLSGQKVQNAKKGLYIVNGRKVVVK